MTTINRRDFLRRGMIGLATVGLGAGVLSLRADADPTESSGHVGDYGAYLKAPPSRVSTTSGDFAPTEDNILGPFYRESAPFRGKVTPPLEPGMVLVIGGRVWGHDTRRPLANAVIDIWQANAHGRYDNDDPDKPPAKGVFKNRARLVVDENGSYEYETIHPGAYQIGPEAWRPSHIHYMVRAAGYQTLVTQLYFKDDPRNAADQFIKSSLIITVQKQKVNGGQYESGVFDIVLAKS